MKYLCAWLAAAALGHGVYAQQGGQAWELSAQTVVVYNTAFPQSRELAEHYARRRGINKERLLGLRCPQTDSMSREEFEQQLRRPLYDTFSGRGWWTVEPRLGRDPATGKTAAVSAVTATTVRVLVLMRGIPFQIRRHTADPKTQKEDEASVDSELTLLGAPGSPIPGALRNPYFKESMRIEMFQAMHGLLLVGRLDGPDTETVKRMIDDAAFAEKNGLRGRAVIDLALKTGAYREGEEWLGAAARQLNVQGVPVYVDRDEPVIREQWPLPHTAFYFGWYASDVSGALKSSHFRFKQGAVACHLHSFSASQLRTPDRGWAGPLLKAGAAATLGNVFEPYLALTTHFDIFTQRLLDGWTLAEAAWNATPVLSWMNVVIGDPLYRPYAKGPGATMGEGIDRDYALYQGTVLKFAAEDPRKLKATLTALSESRGKPHLLELTALYSDLDGKDREAIELLEHAGSVYSEPEDKLRVALYAAEIHRREGRRKEALYLLQGVVVNPVFKNLPAHLAALAMLAELGGGS